MMPVFHFGGAARRTWWLGCVAAGLLLAATAAVAAPKTDVVVLVNGDRITGEVKGLEHNQLRFSTDHMGTLSIEWDKIARVQSDQYLQLERSDGVRFYGQLVTGEGKGDGWIWVRREPTAHADAVPMATLVRANPIVGGSLIDRMDGYVSAGLEAAKANDRRSFNMAAGISSRTRARQWSIDGAANTTNDDVGETERFELRGNWRQFMQNRDFWQGFASLQRNTELDLNLRSLAGGLYGQYFVQSNSADWLGGLGLAYSHEQSTGGSTTDSVEAVLATSFSIFRYDFPETDVAGSLTVLPSLTESGRVRAEANLRAKYEFVDDLYFELTLYGTYDSEPPLADAEQSDYGMVTSLGYSF
jgi:hypothetical protein